MNLVQLQIFGNKTAITYNTYIGGISASVSSASLLATKLGISVGAISNFTVFGSDVKCRIIGGYGIPAYAFSANTNITYYTDSDNLVTSIGVQAFNGCTNLAGTIKFDNCITIDDDSFTSCSKVEYFSFANTTTIGGTVFRNIFAAKSVYIPRCTNLGGTSANNGVFDYSTGSYIVYSHPSLATNNGGSPDGDIIAAIDLGATIRYVSNFTAPITPTITAVSTLNATYIKIVDAGGSINTVEYFEVTINGTYYGKVIPNGYILGLSPSTTYFILLKAVDIYFNKSVLSAPLSASTNTTDISHPTANIKAYYKMEGNVNDSAGSNNGTATAITYTDGVVGQTAVFNGSTSIIKSNSLDFDIFGTTPFSFTALVNLTSLPTGSNTYGIIAIQENTTPSTVDKSIRITSTGKVILYAYDGAVKNATSAAGKIAINTNYVLVGTYDGVNLKVYINGVLEATLAASGTFNFTNPTLAISHISGTTVATNGKIDEVVMWSSALTSGEALSVSSKILSGQHLI
jgi:hypothetical protein